MKNKILFILHLPPPNHGASKVGEFIKNSKINNVAKCEFIPIKSSENIGEIGKFNFKKIYYMAELYFKTLINILKFRPNKVYYTASMGKIAFFRDYLVTSLIRIYQEINPSVEVYYHYHTKGLDRLKNNKLTKFLLRRFLKNSNLILLSPLLKNEFEEFEYKEVYYLPNGVENNLSEEEFENILENRFNSEKIQVLYLNHLIDMKGYMETLFLAKEFRDVIFNFAGKFGTKDDENYFYDFLKKNNMENVIYHGFVIGEKKEELLKKSHALCYISKNDAFPLTLLEAFSYGIPVFTTNEGSISYIVDEKSGMIVNSLDEENLKNKFREFLDKYINKETSQYCRKRYLENFTLEKFEKNLIRILG
ncbi:glycosyltransferase family 4 protein [Caminibacter pacificus]|uniref:Glycosyltransferase involved in cell wall biosynthesis n=1 Tax=Caminibacter pacificus TaxID=1424653 RepID=A0AAJ4RBU4_9BACT|nr:glycosyltransferase family 4 protein [Caminibacter pacificus]ROR39152.1 glycosyltransferase involved in cell wall biosynthesis [Caminibacter pacificus]